MVPAVGFVPIAPYFLLLPTHEPINPIIHSDDIYVSYVSPLVRNHGNRGEFSLSDAPPWQTLTSGLHRPTKSPPDGRLILKSSRRLPPELEEMDGLMGSLISDLFLWPPLKSERWTISSQQMVGTTGRMLWWTISLKLPDRRPSVVFCMLLQIMARILSKQGSLRSCDGTTLSPWRRRSPRKLRHLDRS